MPSSQRGFIQYIVLGVLLILAAGAVAFFQYKHAAPGDLTASLTGSGGVTISSPNNDATLTSPVHVIASVSTAVAGYGSVKTMQVFQNNTLAYQGPGTTVDTNVTLLPAAAYNLTVLALKQNGQLEGSATVNVTVVNPTLTPLPPPSSSSVPPLPPVPSP